MNARAIASIVFTGIQMFCIVDLSITALKAMKRANKLEAELKELKEKEAEASN